MTRRSGLFAAWLALCVFLGGASAAGWAANGLLQVLAIPIILACVWRVGPAMPAGARPLLWLAFLFALIATLSLLPLPASLWSALPGREPISRGFALLGIAPPSLPLSLDARRTVLSALSLLVPLATFLWALRLTRDERLFAAKALLFIAAATIVLGAAQVFGGEGSSLRFYLITTPDRAVGPFANPNHMATLLLTAVPFGALLVGRSLAKKRSEGGKAALWVTLLVFLGVGIALNGSLAGFGLLFAVGFVSFLVFRKARGTFKRRDLAVGAVGVLAFAGLSLLGPLNDQNLQKELDQGNTGRSVSIPTTLQAAGDFFPAGSGLGTFRDIYRTYEDPSTASSTFVNHAHNDYTEVALEMGLAGVLLIAGALAWWAWTGFRAWRADFHGANIARAASVALGAIILHSLVDYPLRTAAVAAVAGLCCAFMLQPPASERRRRSGADTGAGAPRHLEIT